MGKKNRNRGGGRNKYDDIFDGAGGRGGYPYQEDDDYDYQSELENPDFIDDDEQGEDADSSAESDSVQSSVQKKSPAVNEEQDAWDFIRAKMDQSLAKLDGKRNEQRQGTPKEEPKKKPDDKSGENPEDKSVSEKKEEADGEATTGQKKEKKPKGPGVVSVLLTRLKGILAKFKRTPKPDDTQDVSTSPESQGNAVDSSVPQTSSEAVSEKGETQENETPKKVGFAARLLGALKRKSGVNEEDEVVKPASGEEQGADSGKDSSKSGSVTVPGVQPPNSKKVQPQVGSVTNPVAKGAVPASKKDSERPNTSESEKQENEKGEVKKEAVGPIPTQAELDRQRRKNNLIIGSIVTIFLFLFLIIGIFYIAGSSGKSGKSVAQSQKNAPATVVKAPGTTSGLNQPLNPAPSNEGKLESSTDLGTDSSLSVPGEVTSPEPGQDESEETVGEALKGADLDSLDDLGGLDDSASTETGAETTITETGLGESTETFSEDEDSIESLLPEEGDKNASGSLDPVSSGEVGDTSGALIPEGSSEKDSLDEIPDLLGEQALDTNQAGVSDSGFGTSAAENTGTEQEAISSDSAAVAPTLSVSRNEDTVPKEIETPSGVSAGSNWNTSDEEPPNSFTEPQISNNSTLNTETEPEAGLGESTDLASIGESTDSNTVPGETTDLLSEPGGSAGSGTVKSETGDLLSGLGESTDFDTKSGETAGTGELELANLDGLKETENNLPEITGETSTSDSDSDLSGLSADTQSNSLEAPPSSEASQTEESFGDLGFSSDLGGTDETGDLKSSQSAHSSSPSSIQGIQEGQKVLGTDVGDKEFADYTSYTVVRDDTFWKISEKFYGTPTYEKALSRYNNDIVPDVNNLKEGTILHIPDLKSLRECYPSLCPRESQIIPGQTRSGGQKAPGIQYYTTRQGDTLSLIAERLLGDSSRWPEISRLNSDKELGFGLLKEGEQIKLPFDAPLP